MILIVSLTVLLLALVAYIVQGAFSWDEPIGKVKAIGGAIVFLCAVGFIVTVILTNRR